VTGGLCNYSYKLQCKKKEDEGDNENDVALFVKLTFGTPLLFPGVTYFLERTENEFIMMDMFAKISPHPESAVTPYMCFDIEGNSGDSNENMKVLVTQFSSRLEEQAANVFIDGGTIDKDFASKTTLGLAALHNEKVTNPGFNGELKDYFTSLLGIVDMVYAGYNNEAKEQSDRATIRARAIGKEGLDQISDAMKKGILRSDCYIHGDYHHFNMLVEENCKGIEGIGLMLSDVAFIDWEFSHCGSIGKDLGFLNALPVVCALEHALNGDKASSESILEFIDTVWETYAVSIHLEGKDLSIRDVYRQVMGWFACLIMAYGSIGLHNEYLPIEEGRTEDLARVKESMGVLSLECYEMGFPGVPEDATLKELRKQFKDVVQTKLDQLAPPPTSTVVRRRLSLLRASGRRVSDAHSYFSIILNNDESKASELAIGTEEYQELPDSISLVDLKISSEDVCV